jgi:hypothetical protein
LENIHEKIELLIPTIFQKNKKFNYAKYWKMMFEGAIRALDSSVVLDFDLGITQMD